MDHFRGITFAIISNGQALNLYDELDTPENEDGRSRSRYVEAVAGSTFQVKVNLTPDFEIRTMKAEHAVNVRVRIDGRHDSSLVDHKSKKDLQRKFSNGLFAGFAFTGPRQFCKETREWMWSDYSFGNLVLKESSDPGFSVQKAQDLGKIQVTIQRVRMEQRQVPYVHKKKSIPTMSELPEKALKGRPIETTVGYKYARPASPPVRTMNPISLDGEAGKPLVFTIYYRSRRALQMLRCIPRSPSPESQSPKDSPAAPEDMYQEVRDLRARLALLERGLNIKSESSSAHTGVKRERDEEGDEGSRQRRRTTVKVEHVDLTDD